MITKELIEDAKAAGLLDSDGYIKPLWSDPWLEAIAKLVELQRQRERQAVPVEWHRIADVLPSESGLYLTSHGEDGSCISRFHSRTKIFEVVSEFDDVLDAQYWTNLPVLTATQSPELISPHPIVEELTKE